MVYILLIPFDVFASVRHMTHVFSIYDPVFKQQRNLGIYDLYFICYICMIYLCFIGLPFSYFYAQSVQDEEEQEAAMSAEYQIKGMDSSESESEEED